MSKFVIVLILLFALIFQSCEIINPEEQIPSFISVESATIKINDPYQGSSIHNVSDCWVYVNGTMIGVFEVPFTVPVLASGNAHIEIEPGIKKSGQEKNRGVYSMLTNYYLDTVLVPDKVMKLNPTYEYRSGVEFLMVESFDNVGLKFAVSDTSDTTIMRINDERALENYSMYVALDDNHKLFECRTQDFIHLSSSGSTYMEMSYKCNDTIRFGLIELSSNLTATTGIRKYIIKLYPTNGEWNRIYLDLAYYIANADSDLGEFQPFFTAVRKENSPEGKSEIFIDNIKLLHLETE